MGQPKALLRTPHTGRTFVTQLILSLHQGGLDQVAVIGRPDDTALRHEIEGAQPAVEYLDNPSHELGQLSSLLVGLDYADITSAAGVLVVPVDMPLIRADTVRASVQAFLETGPSILRATHQGRHGHPVIFGAATFPALRRADPAVGARAVLRDDPAGVLDFEVDDPGVLRDIDLPAEYRLLFEPEHE
jgi:molybdenum cofactor cytidylyltransferase